MFGETEVRGEVAPTAIQTFSGPEGALLIYVRDSKWPGSYKVITHFVESDRVNPGQSKFSKVIDLPAVGEIFAGPNDNRLGDNVGHIDLHIEFL